MPDDVRDPRVRDDHHEARQDQHDGGHVDFERATQHWHVREPLHTPEVLKALPYWVVFLKANRSRL